MNARRAAFAERLIRAMERDHGCLVGRAAAAWGLTVEQLRQVLLGKRGAGKRLTQLVGASEDLAQRRSS